ncbi:Reverse transcriptase (RNA-dependent DNA polymerase) [Fodinibius salinus]|uniref:RNA-directed DNA polymerase n=1 Tax=Fodinibius salinus TaxID=860790 RepID=A0A5D3YKN5_9BACT|nr:reverse transcriptase family protein [Fodinibius salinus]TYP94000.1 Reverse transcriptase (RNA-dependent DNA polymerase) [Fodinibius salinus]
MVQSPKRLAFLLGIDLKKLRKVSKQIDKYYYEDKELKRDEDGNPRCKNGEKVFRTLHPSTGLLKHIQNRIQTVLLQKIDFPENIQGGIKGKSNITNAKEHKGKKYFLCTDLKKYYPSVDHDLVYEAFLRYDFSHDVSHLLTRLTTYKYSLPQGTPTSPYLANLVFSKYDEQIISKCEQIGLLYTRYVDDIAISSNYNFKKKVPNLLEVIRRSPFQINHEKTFYKIGPTLITGIITKNNELEVRDDQIKKYESESLTKEQKKGLREYFSQVRNS